MIFPLRCFFSISSLSIALAAFAASSSTYNKYQRAILVTGANKGQGKALCERILTEHDDTCVFLCSRDLQKGNEAAAELRKILICDNDSNDDINNTNNSRYSERIHVVQLDVTDPSSVSAAVRSVEQTLENRKLYGLVSNAGILWNYQLSELIDVCAIGVRRILDGFLPLMLDNDEDCGRVLVVSSGLGPLMNGYASEERRKALMDPNGTWNDNIQPMIDDCLTTYDKYSQEDRPKAFEKIGFPGGPFAEAAPDFHMYGLAKMFGDSYMQSLSHSHGSKLRINSVDPGLVYTDLILKMERYKGKDREDTGAQTPKEGVEATMRLLFDDTAGSGEASGRFYAMSKDKTKLVHSSIDKQPEK